MANIATDKKRKLAHRSQGSSSRDAADKETVGALPKPDRGIETPGAALDKQVRRNAIGAKAVSTAPEAEASAGGLRFRAKGFAAHRRRLGLSAAQAGALLGVSGQSIHQREAG